MNLPPLWASETRWDRTVWWTAVWTRGMIVVACNWIIWSFWHVPGSYGTEVVWLIAFSVQRPWMWWWYYNFALLPNWLHSSIGVSGPSRSSRGALEMLCLVARNEKGRFVIEYKDKGIDRKGKLCKVKITVKYIKINFQKFISKKLPFIILNIYIYNNLQIPHKSRRRYITHSFAFVETQIMGVTY